mmetsp:Transcript_8736/g.10925  ORF Transcript_8736/g.10925 Transcript_8736/m.10925 type:complete len:304 (+) Transcript_8736:192-1103(+)
MSGTRLDIVKEILSSKGLSIQEEKESIEDSAKIQTTYIKRLQNDINLTTAFINQANASIERLVSKNEAESPEDLITLKKNIIALCDTYGRLPFLSDKSDVIGIASASSIIESLIQQQREASSYLDKINETNSQAIVSKQSLVEDYTRLLKLIDQKLITGQGKLREIDQKSGNIELDPVSKSQLVKTLNNKLKEARQSEDSLLTHLKRIIIKFLAVSDWEVQHVMTEEKLQENVSVCIELIDKLMTSSINSIENDSEAVWVEINPSEIESKLINHLLMNDIIISRDGSTREKSFLMLRNFGSEF